MLKRLSRPVLTAVLALSVLQVAAACSDDAPSAVPSIAAPPTVATAPTIPAPPDALRIVTTVSPITNIVANVAGNRAIIQGIVPEGTNSHTFEPPPSVARVLAEADVVYLNGLQLEEPTKELAVANVRDGVEVIELGSLALQPGQEIYDFSFPKEGGKPNPHLWTNPLMARRFAELVRDDLTKRDPDGGPIYAANFDRFSGQLDNLSEAMRVATKTIPAERRKLLTYHDSFPYFARDFGWTVIGAIQPADFSEPSPKEVAALIDQVKAEGVTAIFGSEVFPSPVLEQIGKEAGVRYIDSLRDDDLPGAPGDPLHSYTGLMVTDFVTMVEALGGDATALKAVFAANVVDSTAEYAQ